MIFLRTRTTNTISEYGEDKNVEGVISVRLFPGKIKELIDVQSSYAD